MSIKDIIENQTRNYAEEKNILLQFSNVLKPYISLETIERRLEINGFNGVYILDKDLFELLYQSPNTVGLYSHEDKVIVMNQENYNMDRRIGIHEMGHAFLDSENERKIMIDEISILYGKGLEEGAMAILQSNPSMQNIHNINPQCYQFQSILFQQLNVLYKYSNISEYENLLVHLFMNPKTFLPVIRDVYENIYVSRLSTFKINLAAKSAFAMVTGTDALIDCADKQLYDFLNYMNSLYLNVADEKIRNGEKSNELFITSKDFAKTREELLLFGIFNSDIGYMERQELNLDTVLLLINERLETFDNKKINDGRSKIMLPR